MPKLSAFTPLGLLRLSSAPSEAEKIYRAKVAALGGQLSVDDGSRMDAHLYAQSIGEAAARETLRQAWRECLPSGAFAMLPVREREYDVVSGPDDTIMDRRGVLAARRLLPVGCSQVNVENALRSALGDDFLVYRTTPESEAVDWPTAISATELNLQTPSVPRKIVRLWQPVAPGSQQVIYVIVTQPASPAPAPSEELLVGDTLLVQPENSMLSERVTVTDVQNVFGVRLFFTATFAKAHDQYCYATTAPFPQWISTKRHALIVLTASAAADPEKRRKVNELMARMAREVSTWAITDGVLAPGGGPGPGSTTLGPFKVGEGKLGITTIGAIAL